MTAQDTVSRGEEPIEANLAREAIDRSAAAERGGSVVLVLSVAGMLVAAATAIVVLGRSNAEPYILAFLAVLATVGVFSLFALACGILRLSATGAVSPLIKAVVDGAFDGVAHLAEEHRVHRRHRTGNVSLPLDRSVHGHMSAGLASPRTALRLLRGNCWSPRADSNR